MKYLLNNKQFNLRDIESIISEIDSLSIESIDDSLLKELIKILNATSDYKLIDTIALVFSDVNKSFALEALMQKIQEIKYSNHISTLIYACSEYDCADFINLFIDLVIEFNDASSIGAISVLEEIKNPIHLSDKIIAEKRLSNSLITLNQNDEKYKDLRYVLDLVGSMKTK